MSISGFSQGRSDTYWQQQIAAEHEAAHRRYSELPRARSAGNPSDLADYISVALADVSEARDPEK